MARVRHCSNCGEYTRVVLGWCDDCWRAGIKAVGSAAGAALWLWIAKHWLTG